MMTIAIRVPCEGLRASWPATTNPFTWGASAEGHVIINGLCHKGATGAYFCDVGGTEGDSEEAYLLKC